MRKGDHVVAENTWDIWPPPLRVSALLLGDTELLGEPARSNQTFSHVTNSFTFKA